MKTLIKNGTLIDPASGESKNDVLIENNKVIKIAPGISETKCNIFDASGLYVCPGFVDIHVHLREPGYEAMETIETGTRAALKGGFTTVACMPNTNPPVDNEGIVSLIKLRARMSS